MSKKKITIDGGTCPSCGSGSLHYDGTPEFNGPGMTISFECRICHFLGLEHYSVEFTGMEDAETSEWFEAGDIVNAKEKE
jgi:hypothetical protein